jgi:hypothetical protein
MMKKNDKGPDPFIPRVRRFVIFSADSIENKLLFEKL